MIYDKEKGLYFPEDKFCSLSPGLMPIIGGASNIEPPALGDLQIWLKTPIVGLSHDDPIATWPNDGVAGGDAFGSSDGSEKPLYKSSSNTINGLPTMYPIGAGVGNAPSIRFTIDTTAWGAATIYVVCQRENDPASGDGVFGWMTTVGQLNKSAVPWTDGHIYDNAFNSIQRDLGDPTPSLASPFIYGVLSTTNDWRARLNGTEIFSTGTSTYQGYSGAGSFEVGISRESGGSRRPGEGFYAEVMVWDKVLTAPEIAQAELYLSDRFAIAI